MDIYFFNKLSNLIEREKETSSILYSIKKIDQEITIKAMQHYQNTCILLNMYSRSGFILPIEEPEYVNLDFNKIIEKCLDDLEYYKNILLEDTELAGIIPRLMETKLFIIRAITKNDPVRVRVFTLEELKDYNGREGKPAYVAVNGIVYDVTSSPSWIDGTHFELIAGRDLSNEFKSCHLNNSVLSTLPVAGTIGGGV